MNGFFETYALIIHGWKSALGMCGRRQIVSLGVFVKSRRSYHFVQQGETAAEQQQISKEEFHPGD